MPGAVLAGGASRRMGVEKASLPYGSSTLAAHQVSRLAAIFEEVWLVVRDTPTYDPVEARLLFDSDPERSAMSGLLRVLAESEDHVFVLAVDLPLVPEAVIRAIAVRAAESRAAAVLPEESGALQPLAGVWRRSALAVGRARADAGDRSLRGFAQAVEAEAFREEEWRRLDPSGNAFANLNTVEDWTIARGRA
jgi:molybdopterin-guanine dinucleotide biosynthesis protein A